MRRQHFLSASSCAKGFSLIELMVSLTIGLIIAIAAFSAFLGSSSASKMAEAQGRMNEDAQAALSILTQQIRMAQNNPNQSGRTKESQRNPVYSPYPYSMDISSQAPVFELAKYSIRGCDDKFSNIATAAGLDKLNCNVETNSAPDPLGLNPDSIAINYEADAFNTVASGTPKVPTDCLGFPLIPITATFQVVPPPDPASSSPTSYSLPPYYVADNRFLISPNTSNVPPSLYCQGNGINGDGSPSAAKLMVENIENMQFKYGVVGPSISLIPTSALPVAGYLTAYEISKDIRLNDLTQEARWEKVVSVQVCVLVRSEALVATDLSAASFHQCDGKVNNSPPDLRLRRAYYATVVLRNRRN